VREGGVLNHVGQKRVGYCTEKNRGRKEGGRSRREVLTRG